MKILNSSLFFIYALVLHVELIFVFFFDFYIFYFLNLFFVMFFLHYKIADFSPKLFFLYTLLVLLITKLNIYDEVMFEISLFLDILDKVPYMNSEVMYALTLVHLLLLLNLKKFENFWVIMDKKLFGN